jgi:hypothetical protein
MRHLVRAIVYTRSFIQLAISRFSRRATKFNFELPFGVLRHLVDHVGIERSDQILMRDPSPTLQMMPHLSTSTPFFFVCTKEGSRRPWWYFIHETRGRYKLQAGS